MMAHSSPASSPEAAEQFAPDAHALVRRGDGQLGDEGVDRVVGEPAHDADERAAVPCGDDDVGVAEASARRG